mgnify:CR=1 FL=1
MRRSLAGNVQLDVLYLPMGVLDLGNEQKHPKIPETKNTKSLKPIIEKLFKNHPGNIKDFWLATDYKNVIKLLNFFINEKSNLFGDYEDTVYQKNNVLFHSALSPYLNLGLITPDLVIQKILEFNKRKKIY